MSHFIGNVLALTCTPSGSVCVENRIHPSTRIFSLFIHHRLHFTTMTNVSMLLLLVLASSIAADIFNPKIVKLGESCGGKIDNATFCDRGLTCYRQHPIPGTLGICLPEAQLNQICGGSVQYPPQCRSGLVCTYNPDDMDLEGRRGRCQKPEQPKSPLLQGQLGDACGGDLSDKMECGQGLACHQYDDNALRRGVCVPLSQIGEKCGGTIRYPPVCTPNAECRISNDAIPGAFGTCIEVFAQHNEECGGDDPYAKHCDLGLICLGPHARAGEKGICIFRSDDAT